ncbi:MAG: hypothetical protein ABEK16_00050 [Candidatus Nanohalobium sp.]
MSERPYDEYYTKIDNLEVERSSDVAGNTHTFKFSKISNYADDSQPPEKTPVKTKVNYTIFKSGQEVWSNSTVLPANSGTGEEYYSFDWTPSSAGDYTVKVSGISVTSKDKPTRPQSQSLQFTVDPVPTWTVDFRVSDSDSRLKDATVRFGEKSAQTDVNGEVSFTGIEKGTYNYSISKTGYSTVEGTLTVDSNLTDPFLISEALDNTNTAPEVNLPDGTQQLISGEVDTDIDLDDYVRDNSRKSDISWSISKSGLSGVTVSVEDGNVLRMAAAEGFTGSGTVTLTASDPAGATGTDTLSVQVTRSNTAPSVSISDVTVKEDSDHPAYYNLMDKVSDSETSYSNLDLSLSVDTEGCGVSITENDRIQIAPSSDFFQKS